MNSYEVKISLSDQTIINDICFKFFKEQITNFVTEVMTDCHGKIPKMNFDLGLAPTIKVKEINKKEVVLTVKALTNDKYINTVLKSFGVKIYNVAKQINDIYKEEVKRRS